jgi:hypothetical protein
VFMAQRVPEQYLSEQLALVKLSAQIRNFPWVYFGRYPARETALAYRGRRHAPDHASLPRISRAARITRRHELKFRPSWRPDLNDAPRRLLRLVKREVLRPPAATAKIALLLRRHLKRLGGFPRATRRNCSPNSALGIRFPGRIEPKDQFAEEIYCLRRYLFFRR